MRHQRLLGRLLLILWVLGNPLSAAESPETPPSTVWDVETWQDIDGKVWDSDTLLGRVVIVDFWATWCPPCLAEIPNLKRLSDRFGDRLVVLGVALDAIDRRRLRAFLHRQGVTWPQIHHAQGFTSPLARRFGVAAVPAVRVFDGRGRLVGRDLKGAALEAVIQAMVAAEPKP